MLCAERELWESEGAEIELKEKAERELSAFDKQTNTQTLALFVLLICTSGPVWGLTRALSKWSVYLIPSCPHSLVTCHVSRVPDLTLDDGFLLQHLPRTFLVQ